MSKISLKALRVNKNLSLKEASEKLGIVPKTLIQYESGKSIPNLLIIEKMCELYECDVSVIDTKNFSNNIAV